MKVQVISENHSMKAFRANGPKKPDDSPEKATQPTQSNRSSRPVDRICRPGWRWGLWIAYILLVTWLSMAPREVFENVPSHFAHADKIAHFLIYGLFVLAAPWSINGSGGRWRKHGLWVLFAALLYGALMEVGQLLLVTSGRSFEVWDMFANGFGAFVFWWACNTGVFKSFACGAAVGSRDTDWTSPPAPQPAQVYPTIKNLPGEKERGQHPSR